MPSEANHDQFTKTTKKMAITIGSDMVGIYARDLSTASTFYLLRGTFSSILEICFFSIILHSNVYVEGICLLSMLVRNDVWGGDRHLSWQHARTAVGASAEVHVLGAAPC